MAQPNQQGYTLQEYLWEEQRSDTRRDFFNGRVYAMAGGSANHSRIATNLLAALSVALRDKGCEAFNSDLKVGVATEVKSHRRQTDEFVSYPDASVVCGKLEYFKGDRYTIGNPTVLFEVLSPSTRNYDRSFKLEQYQKIPGLQAYVMIDSEQVELEYYARVDENRWLQQTLLDPTAVLNLEALDITLPLTELYRRVDFSQE